jgi:hypothetical protein
MKTLYPVIGHPFVTGYSHLMNTLSLTMKVIGAAGASGLNAANSSIFSDDCE